MVRNLPFLECVVFNSVKKSPPRQEHRSSWPKYPEVHEIPTSHRLVHFYLEVEIRAPEDPRTTFHLRPVYAFLHP